MSRLAAAQALTEKVAGATKDVNDRVQESIAVKRALFGDFAQQWNDAEEAGDAEALSVLEALRPKLKLRPAKQGLASHLFMCIRLVLTVLVASWGCACVLTLTPLRWLHPLFRACGLPNGLLPMDLCLAMWARAVLTAAGVKVRMEGASAKEIWGDGCCGIIVYNHASNLDPFIVNHVCSCLAPKYLGKKVLFKLPLLGWMSLALGMVPINRGDREKAVRTMNETVGGIMRRWRRSVAVAPEGTRTTDGHLRLPFKKGTFHLQEQTRAPLLPVVIHGAYELWPPGQLFTTTGEVTVQVLPAQPPEETDAGSLREASRLALQRSLAKIQAKHPDLGARSLSAWSAMECLFRLLCTAVVFRQFWRLHSALTAAVGLGASGIMCLFLVVTIIVAVVVDQFA
eukprot:CAMPEP_0179056466 /NCGR_PEP_ID=MMETSP0796-20121207/23826_1 /TAXON_ID=73915 /ORGANISM="Pyrodinium bahamense, Strain pbaha01" /LENGTH=397 /DNA_ID=CAMNT_0020753141 /DNA_START=50 /DNA_END=1243 /DNA_ORIENTATION=-